MMELRNTGRRPSRTRRMARVVSALGIAALLGGMATLTACADATSTPLGPSDATPRLAAANAGGANKQKPLGQVLGAPVVSQGLRRATRLSAPITARFTVRGPGGRFEIPGTGLTVQIPAGALPKDQPLEITATALPGDVVAYEFGPHGTVFNKPLTLTQDLRGTDWKTRSDATFEVGYFSGLADLNLSTGTALIRELLPLRMDRTGAHLSFSTNHFSGYMVSWGRK